MTDAPQGTGAHGDRPPRGALIVIAVGLVACVVAALATAGKGEGEAAHLEWVQLRSAPDSKSVPVPGGKGEMQLVDTDIRATGTNVSGYSLFRVASSVRISAASPIGGGRLLCTVKTDQGTEIAQTSGALRATYPRSSEGGIFKQEVPETVLIDFSSRGNELAVLEVEDLPRRFTTERGVKLEWPEYKVGTERLKYVIAGKPKKELVLPFFTVWRATAVPSAEIACALKTSAGTATVRNQAALAETSPPIDEEAEEIKADEREEDVEADEETEEAAEEG